MTRVLPVGLAVSLALNLAVAAALLARASSRVERAEEVAGSAPATSAAYTARAQAPKSAPGSESPPLDPAIPAAFEAGDLSALVAELRRSGFPAEIIRAIVSAELGERYAGRRRELDPDAETRPFWQTTRPDPKVRAELGQLSREHERILRDLLGEDGVHPTTRAMEEQRLVGLPPEKREPVKQILRDYGDMRSELFSAGFPFDQEKLAAINQAERADLEQFLGADLFFEYNVRSGPSAAGLRHQLAAFQPTEEEFRAIFRLQDAFDPQNPPVMGRMTADQQLARSEVQRKLQEQIEAALGPERGAQFARARDHNYRQTAQLVARLRLPQEAANEVWSVREDMLNRGGAIRRDGSLSDAVRAQQVAVLENEARTRLRATLGERGLGAYQEYGGQWLQQLQARPPSP